jgi:hypothetical protein
MNHYLPESLFPPEREEMFSKNQKVWHEAASGHEPGTWILIQEGEFCGTGRTRLEALQHLRHKGDRFCAQVGNEVQIFRGGGFIVS